MCNVALHISVGRIGSCSRKVIPISNQNMSFGPRSVRRDTKTPFIALDTDATSDPQTNDTMTIRELIALP
jgi:hypothetical protein